MAEVHKIEIAGHVTVLETPVEDGFGAELTEAVASLREYQDTVPNPDYDAEAEVPGPETIPNPVSKETFRDLDILSYCRQMVAANRKKDTSVSQDAKVSRNAADRAKIVVVSSGLV